MEHTICYILRPLSLRIEHRYFLELDVKESLAKSICKCFYRPVPLPYDHDCFIKIIGKPFPTSMRLANLFCLSTNVVMSTITKHISLGSREMVNEINSRILPKSEQAGLEKQSGMLFINERRDRQISINTAVGGFQDCLCLTLSARY